MKAGRIFWGLFFIAGAVALLAGKMGFLGELNIWTLLLTILLAGGLIKSVVYRSISGTLFSLAFLAIVHTETLGITEITPWPILGAALLASIGLSIIFPSTKGSKHSHHPKEHFDSTEMVNGEMIDIETSFASAIKYITSDDFQQAHVRCSFGAMKVYFDNAVIRQGEAQIHLDVSFSGVELFIPKTWTVVNQADIHLGGLEEKNHNDSTGSPIVYLTGGVHFGGVDIIYV